MPFLRELRSHLGTLKAALRCRRAWADVLQVEIAEDIAADASTEQGRVGRFAYTAEQADIEAERLIRSTLADGHITDAEIPALRTAMRHVHRAAAADHRITELSP